MIGNRGHAHHGGLRLRIVKSWFRELKEFAALLSMKACERRRRIRNDYKQGLWTQQMKIHDQSLPEMGRSE